MGLECLQETPKSDGTTYQNVRFYYMSFAKHESSKTLWSKLKYLCVGKSSPDTPIPIDMNVLNYYFINISVVVSGACVTIPLMTRKFLVAVGVSSRSLP
ncbi:hypothetical protein J6590_089295 [Homalodisca vitripennis]|nr:hypothetical protein J6590_081170 [Homalodisca vitripennis]KAG8285051.1 hypothetical protein J6590_089295 [Homalodisca vitripennis]